VRQHGAERRQFNVERAGSGRFTVRAQSALADPAAGFANVLDGNAIPPGPEHVGPNADSHFVTIACTAAPGAPRR
jgi:hypothetical protein